MFDRLLEAVRLMAEHGEPLVFDPRGGRVILIGGTRLWSSRLIVGDLYAVVTLGGIIERSGRFFGPKSEGHVTVGPGLALVVSPEFIDSLDYKALPASGGAVFWCRNAVQEGVLSDLNAVPYRRAAGL